TEDSDELTKVLTYHVIPGQLSPEEVSGEHETVEGSKVDVSGEGEDMKFDDAELVCGGVKTANATVYMVDSVMMPEKGPAHSHRGQGPIDEMPLGPWPRFSAPPVIRRGSPADRLTRLDDEFRCSFGLGRRAAQWRPTAWRPARQRRDSDRPDGSQRRPPDAHRRRRPERIRATVHRSVPDPHGRDPPDREEPVTGRGGSPGVLHRGVDAVLRVRPRTLVRQSVADHTVPQASHRLCAQRSVPAESRPRRRSALVRGDRRPGRTDGHRPGRVCPHRDRSEGPSPGAVHSDRHGLLPGPDPRRDLGESQGAAGYHQVTDQRRNEEAARRVGGDPMSTDRDYLAAG